jgi:hypothetical protein
MATSEMGISPVNVFSILIKYFRGQTHLKWISHLLNYVQCAMLITLSTNAGKLTEKSWMFILFRDEVVKSG